MDWNKLFQKHPELCLKKPKKEVVNLASLLKKQKGEPQDKKVYDLGFGAGRHIVYFAKLGYQMHGDDISKSGKEITEKWLKKEDLQAKLGLNDMTKIPYPDNFFDGIINIAVIMHNNLRGIHQCVAEMYRTLKPGGLILVTFLSKKGTKYKRAKKSKEIEPDTFIESSGPEKGVKHHFSSRKEVEKLMRKFQKISLYHDARKVSSKFGQYLSTHWVFIGKK